MLDSNHNGCGMHREFPLVIPQVINLRHSSLILLLLLLQGCQTTQPVVQEVAECPVIEVPQCPVCAAPVSCPDPQVIEKIVTIEKEVRVPVPTPVPTPVTGPEPDLPIIGAIEWAFIEPAELRLEARIDTGAETTSIHAEDIELIEIDEKPYVRYVLRDQQTGRAITQQSALERESRIKQQEGDTESRYVVKMWLTLGKNRELIEINLSNREDFEFPLLIGRNMLTDMVIVDVSKHHTLP